MRFRGYSASTEKRDPEHKNLKLDESGHLKTEVTRPQIGRSGRRAVLIDAAMMKQSSWCSAISATILSLEKRPFATICSNHDLVSFNSLSTIRSLWMKSTRLSAARASA